MKSTNNPLRTYSSGNGPLNNQGLMVRMNSFPSCLIWVEVHSGLGIGSIVVEWFAYSPFNLKSKQINTLLMKPHSIVLISWVCWPWIVSRSLSQVIQKLQTKHFYHCPIYFVILQVVIRCLIPNLYMEFYIYTFQLYSM
jgi:hypothetical protein